MNKYSVPFYYVVFVDVEAESVEQARGKAAEIPFEVSVSNGFTAEFSDSGDVYEY